MSNPYIALDKPLLIGTASSRYGGKIILPLCLTISMGLVFAVILSPAPCTLSSVRQHFEPTILSSKKKSASDKKKEEKNKAFRERAANFTAAFEELQTAGKALFADGDSVGALQKWAEAIALDQNNKKEQHHVLYSNRCAANLKLLRTRDAVADARKCTELKPDWVKGWTRLGDALFADKQMAAATDAYEKGLKLEPDNSLLTERLTLAKEEKAAAEKAEAEAAKEAAAAKAAEEAAKKAAEEEAAKKLAEEPVIGIDLGTTYSCVAVWGDNGVKILTDEDGSRTMPSFVGWAPTGERFIGQRAKSAAAKHTKTTVFDIKRIIGQRMTDEAVQKEVKRFPFPVVKGPEGQPLIQIETQPGQTKKFSPEEISAMVLGRMKQIAEKALNRPIKKAVVTVPAYFNDAQRQATKNAGAIAGLEVLRIINEPTAAALAYGLDQKADNDKDKGVNVLIFDLGGGTFDVTALNIDGGIFDVLATGGDTQLGGEDFDNALLDWLVTEFKKKRQLEISDATSMAKLKAAAERAKREVSQQQSTKVEIAVAGKEYSVDVTRAQFEALNMQLFDRTLETVKAVLKDAKLNPSDIDDIVLVGGSTRVPKIQELLSEFFGGRQLCRSVNPDEAVAFGAAVQGAILSGARNSLVNSIVLVDVTPLSLGVEVNGCHMSKIIPRNFKIPCTKSAMYTTEHDYEPGLDVRIFEGERPKTRDNHLLGEFHIANIEQARRGEPKVEVTFELDTNGILKVTARDKKTGAAATCTINNACKGLSDSEIARMVAESEEFAKQDEELRQKIEVKNAMQSVAFDMREKNPELADETLDWLEKLNIVTYSLQALELEQRRLEKKFEGA
eukprot:gnl/TRDRNA2_/TRDRNA2_152516_c0_seq1.p1 gnl/TRDRNA2_/TRDRNA2_152516_c0~~gnl/TRDRNA2_/TRDRNA2_152516_c0_seq1.p1  ORF type:complete len:843 (-),score=227.79 gnl/TRDRNA2_/TRDRNA2_152516_c0_seq1:76-2604(-)